MRRSWLVIVGVVAAYMGLTALASSSQAWTVTFQVYGGGRAFVTNFPTHECGSESAVTPNGALQTSCTTPDSYVSGGVYRFRPVPADGYGFDKWEWITPGVACDNPPPVGAEPNDCQFAWALGPGAGNYSIRAYFHDLGQPAPNLTGPSGVIADSTPSFSWSSDDPVSSYTCRVDSTEFSCGQSHTTTTLFDGAHSFSVRSTDSSGNISAWSTRSFTVDTTPPVTTIAGGPANGSATQSRSATFTLSALDAALFTCQLNGAPLMCGAGPLMLSGLVDGSYTLSVRATDGVGNQESSAKTRTWTVDNVPPETVITGGPGEGSPIASPDATFAFDGAGAARYECRVDGAPFAPCSGDTTHGVSGLALGGHTFEVRAVDAAGNVDASPAQRTWTVVILDADGDGWPSNLDCKDENPAVNPGMPEIPGNAVDENCDRVRAPYPLVDSSIAAGWKVFAHHTSFTRLVVLRARAGSTVRLLCRGAGCAFRTKARRITQDRRRLRLSKLVRGSKLRAGTRLEVRVTKPRTIGIVKRYTSHAPKDPGVRELCLRPGARRPGGCPL